MRDSGLHLLPKPGAVLKEQTLTVGLALPSAPPSCW